MRRFFKELWKRLREGDPTALLSVLSILISLVFSLITVNLSCRSDKRAEAAVRSEFRARFATSQAHLILIERSEGKEAIEGAESRVFLEVSLARDSSTWRLSYPLRGLFDRHSAEGMVQAGGEALESSCNRGAYEPVQQLIGAVAEELNRSGLACQGIEVKVLLRVRIASVTGGNRELYFRHRGIRLDGPYMNDVEFTDVERDSFTSIIQSCVTARKTHAIDVCSVDLSKISAEIASEAEGAIFKQHSREH